MSGLKPGGTLGISDVDGGISVVGGAVVVAAVVDGGGCVVTGGTVVAAVAAVAGAVVATVTGTVDGAASSSPEHAAPTSAMAHTVDATTRLLSARTG